MEVNLIRKGLAGFPGTERALACLQRCQAKMYPTSNVSTEEPCIVQDLEDTTGSWELYGQEDEKRYPSLQAEFFNRAAAPLTRRESLLAFTFVGVHLPRLADAGGLDPSSNQSRCVAQA
jgi:hypothetical protein